MYVERDGSGSITVTERPHDGEDAPQRVLKIELGNMMDVTDIHIADIVMLETDIPQVTPESHRSSHEPNPIVSRTLHVLVILTIRSCKES